MLSRPLLSGKKSENGEAAGTTHRLCDWVINLVSIQPINKRNGDHDFLTSVFPRLASARSTFSCSDPCVCCDWLNKRVRFCKTLVTRKLLKKFTGNARAENDDGKYSRWHAGSFVLQTIKFFNAQNYKLIFTPLWCFKSCSKVSGIYNLKGPYHDILQNGTSTTAEFKTNTAPTKYGHSWTKLRTPANNVCNGWGPI